MFSKKHVTICILSGLTNIQSDLRHFSTTVPFFRPDGQWKIHPSIQFLLNSMCLLWRGSTVYALIHSGFPFLKWSCSRELKFLSYSHSSQLVPSTAVSMVPFRMRPSRCFVLILSPEPSPSDASHLGYCKHKRLTVMNHGHYKIWIYHTTFPLFQSRYLSKESPWARKKEKQVRTFTHFNSCILMLGQVECIVEKSWTKWILPTTWLGITI